MRSSDHPVEQEDGIAALSHQDFAVRRRYTVLLPGGEIFGVWMLRLALMAHVDDFPSKTAATCPFFTASSGRAPTGDPPGRIWIRRIEFQTR